MHFLNTTSVLLPVYNAQRSLESTVAEILEVSRRTVELDWRMARAWLQNELSDEQRR